MIRINWLRSRSAHWLSQTLATAGHLAALATPALTGWPRARRRAWAIVVAGAGLALAGWAVAVLPVPGAPVFLPGRAVWLLAGAIAWLYGLSLGSGPTGHEQVQVRLVLGALILGLTLTVAGAAILEAALLSFVAPLVLVWALGSIVALALVRLVETASATPDGPAVASFWPPLLLAIALGCLALAAVLSLAAGPLTALLARPAAAVLQVLFAAVAAVGAGLVYLLQWLVHLLMRRADPNSEPPVLPVVPGLEPLRADEVVREISPALLQAARLAGEARAATPDETRESYASVSALKLWSGRRWRRLRARFGQGASRLVAGRGEPATATAAYRRLLRVAAQAGLPRPPAMTPHRFQPQLDSLWPGREDHAAAILTAFAHEYYGGEGEGARWPAARPHWVALTAGEGQGKGRAPGDPPS